MDSTGPLGWSGIPIYLLNLTFLSPPLFFLSMASLLSHITFTPAPDSFLGCSFRLDWYAQDYRIL